MEDSISNTDSHRHGSKSANNAHCADGEFSDDERTAFGMDTFDADARTAFGMDTFDADAREAFGHELRIFMALKDGSATPPESDHPEKAMPGKAPAIALRLKQLGQDIASGTADQPKGSQEQFQRQQATGNWQLATKHTYSEIEKRLLNSQDSFQLVRTLSLTRFRFRVVNQNGQDIRDALDSQNAQKNMRVQKSTLTIRL